MQGVVAQQPSGAQARPATAPYVSAVAGLSPFSVIGVDVGGTKIAAGLALYELRGRTPVVAGYRCIPTRAHEGGPAVLGRILELVRDLAATARLDEQHPLWGVGVATAGRVDMATGSIASANDLMPGWSGQPVAAAVEHAVGLPCAVLNDVQGHALGELRHGAAAGARACVTIAAGTGVGGAIIADGHLVMGAHGFAGEIGHMMSPAAAGITCACGATGHLESVASGSGIEARYRDLTGRSVHGAEVSRLAEAGETDARRVIEVAGHSLGEAIGSLARLIDPEIVVVSGSVCRSGALWRDSVRKGLDEQLPAEMRGLPIATASLGANAPIVGAAEYLLDRLGS